MDLTSAKQRVHDARVGRLGTVTPAGRPHLVPVCFALLDEVVYTAVDAKPKSTLDLRRLQNIQASPATCLLVDHYDENWALLWWVRLDGIARVIGQEFEAEHVKKALISKYPQYRSVAIPGPVIAIDVAAWVAWP